MENNIYFTIEEHLFKDKNGDFIKYAQIILHTDEGERYRLNVSPYDKKAVNRVLKKEGFAIGEKIDENLSCDDDLKSIEYIHLT